MDTLKFPVPHARTIVHHARFQNDVATTDGSGAAAAASDHAAAAAVSRSRREVWRRTVDEHHLNAQMQVFVPRVRLDKEDAQTTIDTLEYFAAAPAHVDAAASAAVSAAISAAPDAPAPLFYYRVTLPFSVLLSDDFLRRYVLSGRGLWGLSSRAHADRANGVQLTPPGLMRLRVDTDTFELLGMDAPAAHSEFKICSTGNIASKPNVRERIITVDLMAHARIIALHTAKETAAAAAGAATGADSKSQQQQPHGARKVDKKLERLRWCLSRVSPAEMDLLWLDESGRCGAMHFPEGVSAARVEVRPTLRRFGAEKHGAEPVAFAVPCVAEFARLLPPRPAADASAAARSHKNKKQRTDPVSATEEGAAAAAAAAACTSTCTSAFPVLPSNGTSAREVWTDLQTYLGLVGLGIGPLLADPNGDAGTNLFQSEPLCPHLSFVHGEAAAAASASAPAEAAVAPPAPVEEDMISLSGPGKDKKRKRNNGATQPASVSSQAAACPPPTPASGQLVSWRGMVAPSFVAETVSRARSLLASPAGVGVPFVSVSVRGFDDAIISWRDKEHQVWMAGCGAQSGGGENHYTIVVLPEGEDAAARAQQQYVVIMQLGEMDRTH